MVIDTSEQLVDQWLATWVHVRDIAVTRVDRWPLVHVRSATRETELVCVDPGLEAWSALTAHVADDPRAMLTVVAGDVRRYLTASAPPGVRVDRDDETLMSTRLQPMPAPAPALPSGLTPRWEVDDRRATYTLESDDSVAAAGTVGVLGRVATFDAVETTPAFQRRGLGRHVLAALTTRAIEQGARHGVLAASAPGRQLYETLGWSVRLQMLSLMGTGPACHG